MYSLSKSCRCPVIRRKYENDTPTGNFVRKWYTKYTETVSVQGMVPGDHM